MEKLLTTDDEIKGVEKRKDGSVKLDYNYGSYKATLVFTREKNTNKVKITGTSEYLEQPLPWSPNTPKRIISTIDDASDFTKFSKQLGNLLDQLVTTSRKSIPEKAEKVYTLLGFDKKTSQVLEELDSSKDEELLAQDELFREEENSLKEEVEQGLQQV